MYVVGHHDGNAQVEVLSVVMQTAVQHNGSNVLWQDPSVVSAERNKVLPVINLKMRKLPAVEGLWHKDDYVGTAALGCPGAQLRAFDSSAAPFPPEAFSAELERRCPRMGIPLLERKTKASFARPDSRGRLSPHDHCWFNSRQSSLFSASCQH
jgi:hypothetical protein